MVECLSCLVRKVFLYPAEQCYVSSLKTPESVILLVTHNNHNITKISQCCNFVCSDYDRLDEEITDIRNKLKPKVNKLRDLEEKDELKGFNLVPLSADEHRSLQDVL